MAKKINIITIPPDKQVQVTIGGMFFQRLHKLLLDYSEAMGKEKLVATLKMIELDKAGEDSAVYNLETLFILVRDVEKEFHQAGHAVEREIDPDDYIDSNGKEKG